MKKIYIKCFIFLIIAVLTEILIFNYRTLESLTFPPAHSFSISAPDGTDIHASQYISFKDMEESYLLIDNIDTKACNLYMNVSAAEAPSETLTVQLWARDEGNNQYYRLPEITIDPDNAGSRYIKLNLSGQAKSIKITFKNLTSDTLYIGEIGINCYRPLNISLLRLAIIYILFLVIYALRPGSGINRIPYLLKSRYKTLFLGALFLAEFSVVCGVSAGHQNFLNPPWPHHYQYHQLAVSLTEGHFYLDIEPSEKLQQMENPYDTGERTALDADSQWDTAYYNGKYYTYFGILPVLVYYLPYYIITGQAFPTFSGILLNCAAIIAGSFFLLDLVIRKYFRRTCVGLFITLQASLVLGIGLLLIVNPPTFYNMPVSLGLALTLWGLYFWLKSIGDAHGTISRPYMILGSVFMALVAACRPQLLMGSFLAVPLFWVTVKKSFFRSKKQTATSLLMAAIPYIIVAALLMYYNYARFGSPFDFGANYNLTTNDMTHRGFHLDRLPFGLFMYLIQPPAFHGLFPFITSTNISTGYQGTTIAETMYGGFFWFNLISGALLFLGNVKTILKKKGLWTLCILSVSMAFVIVCADIEMAGILQRYGCDFGLFFTLPSVIILLAFHEKTVISEKGRQFRRYAIRNIFSRIMLYVFLLTIMIYSLWLLAA